MSFNSLANRLLMRSILCGDIAIKSIEEPFVSDADDEKEWAI